jgi:5-methyltetrahydrofolate--homocysteine methyltransferase
MLTGRMNMSEQIEKIKQAVVEGRHNDIEAIVQAAVREGSDVNRILDEALIGAMDIVGKRFTDGQIYVPEMLVAALAMKRGLTIIKPFLKGMEKESKGRILMGTVRGDNHDIGKGLVIMMLEGSGFDVVDLGVDVSLKRIVRKVAELKPQVLGLSSLLTTTMPEMPKIIQALVEKGLRQELRIMVGGAPVDAKFAENIGADGYGKDAAEAVQLARAFTSELHAGVRQGHS